MFITVQHVLREGRRRDLYPRLCVNTYKRSSLDLWTGQKRSRLLALSTSYNSSNHFTDTIMAKVSRTIHFTRAVLLLGLLFPTMVQSSLRSRRTVQDAPPRPYRFEDEDYVYEDTPYRKLRGPAEISKHFQQLLKKEIDDGSLQPDDDELNAQFASGELPCPDGDDEHVYLLRRVYPCRWNVAR